jgi:hypothetical protein
VLLWGCSSPGSAETQETANVQHQAVHPEQALLEDLTVANRILARQLDILDIQGRVTARSRVNPNHYYIARFVSPGGASVSDFIENDLDSHPVHGPRTDQAREIYLHGEIYNLVDQAYQLRQNAVIQRQVIGLRGKVAFLNEQPAQPVQPNEAPAPAPTGPAEGRAWIYWSQNVSLD